MTLRCMDIMSAAVALLCLQQWLCTLLMRMAPGTATQFEVDLMLALGIRQLHMFIQTYAKEWLHTAAAADALFWQSLCHPYLQKSTCGRCGRQ